LNYFSCMKVQEQSASTMDLRTALFKVFQTSDAYSIWQRNYIHAVKKHYPFSFLHVSPCTSLYVISPYDWQEVIQPLPLSFLQSSSCQVAVLNERTIVSYKMHRFQPIALVNSLLWYFKSSITHFNNMDLIYKHTWLCIKKLNMIHSYALITCRVDFTIL